MTFAKKIKDEIMEDKNNLFKSFLPNSKYSFNFQSIKKFNNFRTVVVIGMGGSILGTKAIYSFLKHKIKKNSSMSSLEKKILENLRKN